jgi:hypothetical protein
MILEIIQWLAIGGLLIDRGMMLNRMRSYEFSDAMTGVRLNDLGERIAKLEERR